MAERLGMCILPRTRWSAQEIQTIAREAEDAGFDAIFTNEFGNDALATAQLMGAAPHRILVGTYIANISVLAQLFRVSGFAAEAAQMEQGGGSAALTDRLLDATCLLGPVARCREQLATFRAAGVELPILVPSSRDSGVEEVRIVIQAFRR
jgi:alkanesulfonate monooxygenase SsuD/methylene tetrahydromethanopterin reductase-like flavin-dependent oxidoreductase (luciferase family)